MSKNKGFFRIHFFFSCMDTIKWCHVGHVLENISKTCSYFMCTSRCARTGLTCLFQHKHENMSTVLYSTHVQPCTFEMYCTFQVLENILASACPTVVKNKRLILSFGSLSRKHFKNDSKKLTHKNIPYSPAVRCTYLCDKLFLFFHEQKYYLWLRKRDIE